MLFIIHSFLWASILSLSVFILIANYLPLKRESQFEIREGQKRKEVQSEKGRKRSDPKAKVPSPVKAVKTPTPDEPPSEG